MFEILGLSLLLAALLTFNSLASLIISGLWRAGGRLTERWTASSRARLLFSLRVLPALLAFLTVALLVIPAYVIHEPRHAAEPVSFKLGLLAFLSATGITLSIYRFLAATRATANLTSDWLKQGKPIQIDGININAYQIKHAFPLIAIVGFLRPRLFIASQVLEILTPAEVAAAVAHENGHLAARDNLKRGLLRACRDALLIIPVGRSLDRAWSDASEEAADENAAQKGHGVALDLASTLVKLARIIPHGARPTMPAGAFVLGDEEKGIKSRVRRLIALATPDSRRAVRHPVLERFIFWGPTCLLFFGLLVAASNPYLLVRVHYLIEHAVFALA